MCSKNGGLFIKVGQHVGALQYLLPREYVQTFKVFHSEAPSTPLPRMKQVIEEDLGRPGIWLLVQYSAGHRRRLRKTRSDMVVSTIFTSNSQDNDLLPLWLCDDWPPSSLAPSWWDLLRAGWRTTGCCFSCTVPPWGSQGGWKGRCSEDTTSWRGEERLYWHGHNGREWSALTP